MSTAGGTQTGDAPGAIGSSVEGPVATVLIDRTARRNAMTVEMYRAMAEVVSRLRIQPGTRVLVLRGASSSSHGSAGEVFCAGSDVAQFPQRRVESSALNYATSERAAWDALASCEQPVIAAIRGPCIGGGVALALHCDLRIAATGATFGLPPARLGIAYPAEAVHRLAALVGPAVAKRLLFTAETIDAAEALRLGLVNEVVPGADFDERLGELAQTMARLAPLSLRAAKLAVDYYTLGTNQAADVAAAAGDCYASDDHAEGIAAFAARRNPNFTGR